MIATIDDIKKISFFKHLNIDEMEHLISISKKRTLSKGEVLFYEKEIASNLTILLDGIVKVYKIDPKNNEIVIHRFSEVALIAEMATFETLPYPASAAFETEGNVLEIDFEKFKERLLYNKEVALAIFKSLTQKIKYLDNVISLNIVLNSTSRVAKYICENKDALKMKNNELAKHLHMTPETLSRTFKKFARLGFIQKKNCSYVIVDKEALAILYE
jgi:CRP/FNR family transcriptional regulator